MLLESGLSGWRRRLYSFKIRKSGGDSVNCKFPLFIKRDLWSKYNPDPNGACTDTEHPPVADNHRTDNTYSNGTVTTFPNALDRTAPKFCSRDPGQVRRAGAAILHRASCQGRPAQRVQCHWHISIHTLRIEALYPQQTGEFECNDTRAPLQRLDLRLTTD